MTFELSPSLVTSPDGSVEAAAAYELKFYLQADQAEPVEAWARRHLMPDAHGDEGRYRTTSLYCDTAGLDVYHRTPGFRKGKLRLRRYGELASIFLERKKRKGDRVRKRRIEIPDGELAMLGESDVSLDWNGLWFYRQLRFRELRPSCRIAYERTAFMGKSSTGPIRLTMDQKVFGVPECRWQVTPVVDGKELLPDGVILELKFREVLPQVFLDLLAELPPSVGRVSKYRLCINAWGLGGERNGCCPSG